MRVEFFLSRYGEKEIFPIMRDLFSKLFISALAFRNSPQSSTMMTIMQRSRGHSIILNNTIPSSEYLEKIGKIGKIGKHVESYIHNIEKQQQRRPSTMIINGRQHPSRNHHITIRNRILRATSSSSNENITATTNNDDAGPSLAFQEEQEEHDFWSRVRSASSNAKKKTSETGIFQVETNLYGTNFTSIGGYFHIKNELLQVVDMMNHPENYTRYNVRIPRGILLEGPPGNGKTLLARCFAGETNASFIRCSGAEFNEKYIGVGSSRLRELFKLASDNQPTVLFIDEFDAIGRKRGGADDASSGERDTTLNQLLTLMDGFQSLGNVLIMGATNRADILDKAVTRPGRFDKIIHIPNPDAETRKEIIDIHVHQKPIQVQTTDIVRMTTGFSGAMIENLLNEATLLAIRNNSIPIGIDLLDTVRHRMVFGVSMAKRNISQSIRRRIAIHETGHLINALATTYYEKPIRVTIDTENAQSLGMTIFQKEDVDDGIFVRDYLDEKIRVLLGGRAAEEILFGHSVSSGSVSDLESAFQLIKQMILEYGMGNHIVYPFLSEEYKKRIDDEIHEYIEVAYHAAKAVLLQNITLLHIIVHHLLERGTLTEQDIHEIIRVTPICQDKIVVSHSHDDIDMF